MAVDGQDALEKVRTSNPDLIVSDKQIVALHGGRVWAESEKGKDSTFTIELAAINQRVRTNFGSLVAG